MAQAIVAQQQDDADNLWPYQFRTRTKQRLARYARDTEICRRNLAGERVRDLATSFGLSGARVREILMGAKYRPYRK